MLQHLPKILHQPNLLDPGPPETREGLIRAERFILRLGKSLHEHGLPSDRLEEALLACAAKLELRAQLFCTPTSLFASFDGSVQPSTHLVRVEPGAVDLGRLSDLSELIDDLVSGDPVHRELTLSEAEARLEALPDMPRRWGPAATVVSYGVASSSAACFLGGSLADVIVALGVGSVVGLLAQVATRHPTLGRVFEPVAAALTAMLALIVSPGGHAELATLASLIVLVPGFTVTVGMSELATRHLAAGTARLAGALVSFLGIGFGVALGRALGGALPRFDLLPDGALPEGALWVALILAPLSFTVLFGARRRDIPWILAAGWLAWFGTQAGAALLGPDLAGFVGALLVGVGSHLLARHSARPALVTLVPGIMLLVPGSFGFRSVSSFMGRDTLGGVEAAFDMGLGAMSIVAGLLLAHALVPPRRAL